MKVVDLFAGWGGFSTGAEQAGCTVVRADNHWKLAVDVHTINHPNTKHVCQDLCLADWRDFPRYDLLLAAPSCQPHSEAAQPGQRAYHARQRVSAWAVVDCVEVTRPKAFAIENVPQFREWDVKKVKGGQRGKMYQRWLGAFEDLGYHITEQIVDASWYGVPQLRERLVVTGSLKRAPAPLTRPANAIELPFASCIDWSAPGWRPISSCRKPNARARLKVAASRFKYALSQHVTGHRGLDLCKESIRTITTKDQWCVVYSGNGGQYRPLTMRELARGMGFPETFRWPDGLSRQEVSRGIGNAICVPKAKAVVERIAEAA